MRAEVILRAGVRQAVTPYPACLWHDARSRNGV